MDLPAQIATAVVDDAAGIAQVHVATWQQAYAGIIPAEYLASLSVPQREETWRQILSTGTTRVVVARIREEVVGFVVFGKSRDHDATTDAGEVHAIYVLPAWWAHGIGRELWLCARGRLREEGFTSVTLWVLTDNARAVSFYRKAGFELDPSRSQQLIRGGRSLTEVRYVAALT